MSRARSLERSLQKAALQKGREGRHRSRGSIKENLGSPPPPYIHCLSLSCSGSCICRRGQGQHRAPERSSPRCLRLPLRSLLERGSAGAEGARRQAGGGCRAPRAAQRGSPQLPLAEHQLPRGRSRVLLRTASRPRRSVLKGTPPPLGKPERDPGVRRGKLLRAAPAQRPVRAPVTLAEVIPHPYQPPCRVRTGRRAGGARPP